jgi:hypothetical protein
MIEASSYLHLEADGVDIAVEDGAAPMVVDGCLPGMLGSQYTCASAYLHREADGVDIAIDGQRRHTNS